MVRGILLCLFGRCVLAGPSVPHYAKTWDKLPPRGVRRGLVGLVPLLLASQAAVLVKLRALLGAADLVLEGQEYVPQWCLLAHGSSLELCGPTVLAPAALSAACTAFFSCLLRLV